MSLSACKQQAGLPEDTELRGETMYATNYYLSVLAGFLPFADHYANIDFSLTVWHFSTVTHYFTMKRLDVILLKSNPGA